MFAEDPVIMKRRQDLERRRDRLTSALSLLSSIPTSYLSSNVVAGASAEGASSISESSGHEQGESLSGGGPVRLQLTVAIGQYGIGVVVIDTPAGQLQVQDFRAMPNNLPNPSLEAGIKAGDIIEKINGKTPTSSKEAGELLRAAKDAAVFTVLRRN